MSKSPKPTLYKPKPSLKIKAKVMGNARFIEHYNELSSMVQEK